MPLQRRLGNADLLRLGTAQDDAAKIFLNILIQRPLNLTVMCPLDIQRSTQDTLKLKLMLVGGGWGLGVVGNVARDWKPTWPKVTPVIITLPLPTCPGSH